MIRFISTVAALAAVFATASLGQAATNDHRGSPRATINTQLIGAGAHQQRSPPWILPTRRPPPTRIPDGRDHIRPLTLQVHRHDATLGSVGMLHGIGARLPDRNEQISNHAWPRADRGQPATHCITNILQRPGLRRQCHPDR